MVNSVCEWDMLRVIRWVALAFFMLLLVMFGLSSLLLLANERISEQYTELQKPVPNSPPVVEFFSFYCPPCRAFSEIYHVSNFIDDSVSKGQQVYKIHVGSMGELGAELTKAWVVAKVLNVEDKVEIPLFRAIQVKHSVKTVSDIRQVFIDSGVPRMVFDNAIISPEVKHLTKLHIKMAKEFNVSRTPSFYVNGKYLVVNSAIKPRTVNEFGKRYAKVVSTLLSMDE